MYGVRLTHSKWSLQARCCGAHGTYCVALAASIMLQSACSAQAAFHLLVFCCPVRPVHLLVKVYETVGQFVHLMFHSLYVSYRALVGHMRCGMCLVELSCCCCCCCTSSGTWGTWRSTINQVNCVAGSVEIMQMPSANLATSAQIL